MKFRESKFLKPLRLLTEYFSGRDTWMEIGVGGMTPDDLQTAYIDFMAGASESCHVVTGDLLPQVYETNRMIDVVTRFLKQSENSMSIVISPVPGRDLAISNPRFIEVVKQHNNLHLYKAKFRLEQHYAIADDRHVFLQEPNHPVEGPRYQCTRYNDVPFARKWQKHFMELVETYSESLTDNGTA